MIFRCFINYDRDENMKSSPKMKLLYDYQISFRRIEGRLSSSFIANELVTNLEMGSAMLFCHLYG